MILRRFLLILAITVTLTLVIVVWLFPSHEDFRFENHCWNGTGNLQAGNEIKPIESLSRLPSASAGTTFILVPYLQFTPDELDTIRSFTSSGGALVLADDYGYGNDVLEYLGLTARFSGRALLDPLSNYNSEWLPRVSIFTDDSLTSGLESLVLNHATSLLNIAPGEIMAQSSLFSFLDDNSNRTWNEGEPTGRKPVISRHMLGSGQVILIADASIFINSMATMASNSNLLSNIIKTSPEGVYFDQSHLSSSNLQETKAMLAKLRSLLAAPLGLLLLIALVFAITLFPLWRRQPDYLNRSLS
ncbi:MAG: DUF4350 domain-containing protein [Dehalococcoidales bacterium]|nr:DUF4350 domain-containing protein [Dehalococcoidales bacterium]